MNFNGQSGEQVLMDLETKVVAQALTDWFARHPYIRAVYEALSPDDRNSVIEKVRPYATEAGFMSMDTDKWLSYYVHKMRDDGKLPEIEKAQQVVYAHAQAAEDAFIQNGNRKDVERYL